MLACAALTGAAPAGAATFKEYSLGTAPAHLPRFIKAGPDGNLWFADGGTQGGIGRISPAGELFAEFGAPGPFDLAFGATGTAYWAGDKTLGERDSAGVISESSSFGAAAAAVAPNGEIWHAFKEHEWSHRQPSEPSESGVLPSCTKGQLAGFGFDHSGGVWAAFNACNIVREIGVKHLQVDLPPDSWPQRIATGPEGDLWVTMFHADAVDRITPAGQRTRFPLSAGAGPYDIALGPDGALWITEYQAGKIARLTTDGVVTGEFPIPTPNSEPIGITAGPDGAMWFTESEVAKIGRITIDRSTTTPPPVAGTGGSPGGTRDTSPPSFTKAPSLRPNRFRSKGRSGGRIPKGGALTFSVSEASTIKAKVSAARAGRRSHGVCVGVSRSNRGKPHCRRYVAVGSLTFKAAAGANRFAFTGRVGGHALQPGAYSLNILAIDSAGNGSSPANVTFSIAP